MTREEQIEEYIKIHANSFSFRNGYTTVEDLMRGMATWCDNNPKNDWVSVEDALPPNFVDEDGQEYDFSIAVAVKTNRSKYWHMAEYYYDTKEWICEENNTYVIRDGYGSVTHWKTIEM